MPLSVAFLSFPFPPPSFLPMCFVTRRYYRPCDFFLPANGSSRRGWGWIYPLPTRVRTSSSLPLLPPAPHSRVRGLVDASLRSPRCLRGGSYLSSPRRKSASSPLLLTTTMPEAIRPQSVISQMRPGKKISVAHRLFVGHSRQAIDEGGCCSGHSLLRRATTFDWRSDSRRRRGCPAPVMRGTPRSR